MQEKTYHVPALTRAFDIFELLAAERRGLNKTEIAQRLKLPYSTTLNLLNTMLAYEYVDMKKGGKYRLANKMQSLKTPAGRNTKLIETAKPFMASLARRSGETVQLLVPSGDSLAALLRIDASGKVASRPLPPPDSESIESDVGKGLLAAQSKIIALDEVTNRNTAANAKSDGADGPCIAAIRNRRGNAFAAIELVKADTPAIDQEGTTRLLRWVLETAEAISREYASAGSREYDFSSIEDEWLQYS